MGTPDGFTFRVAKDGSVHISHHGRAATTLRGRAAHDFLDTVDSVDDQELMARVTGNYKRGNERTAQAHPRNRGR